MTSATGRARARLVAFVAVCALSASVAVGYSVRAADRVERTRAGGAAQVSFSTGSGLAAPLDWASGPHLGFVGTGGEQAFGTLAVTPLDGPARAPVRTGLQCQVAHAAGGRGICLAPERELIAYQATLFDDGFRSVGGFGLGGLPSRTRVAPGGALGAITVFVSGHSYAIAGFSTATTLVDMNRGEVIANLEEFEVRRDGRAFSAPDFNYWGVTFTADARRFYATLGTGGETYLVEGDVARRTARVLRSNVECPSLSPDGTRLVFKKRVSGGLGPVQWRLHLLDLATMTETPLAETRNVDDQVEWLDDRGVAYSLPRPAPSGVTDTWVVPVDGSEPPRIVVPGGRSPVAVRAWPAPA
ncbi:MAG: hypothetical protein ACT4OS_10760 [Acidimicrobiales bacterium]